MNTEYVNLDNKKSKVKYEVGNIKKNDTKFSDKVLIIEKKIEKIKKEQKKIKINLIETKKIFSRALFILKLKPFLLGSAMLVSLILAGILTRGLLFPGTLTTVTTGFGLSLLVSSVILNECKSILKKAEKQIKELQIKFEDTEKLEKKYVIELNNVKKQLNDNKIKEVEKPITQKEKSEVDFSIVEDKIEDKLDKDEENQKKLVLK